MENYFKHSYANWVRYDRYEIRAKEDGTEYVLPAPGAHPEIYNPMKNYEQLILDAVNTGMLIMGRKSPEVIRDGIMEFVGKYGLLGFMTALPTTPEFLLYERVYLPKNAFIREEVLDTKAYMDRFFPFEKLHFSKNGLQCLWTVDGDPDMLAILLTASEPQERCMVFQRQYGEPYLWLREQFRDWAFDLANCFFHYYDYDRMTEEARRADQLAFLAYDGVMPTYHIELLDRPTLVWNFYSLLLEIRMLYYGMLTDDQNPVRMCQYCQRAFIVRNGDEDFCSNRCRKLMEEQNHRS